MNTTRGKRNYEYKIGQIVWAKLKGFPFWPSRVANPEEKPDLKRPKKKKTFLVYFFGTNDYSFIGAEDMRPYFLFKEKLVPSSKKLNFVQAVEEVEKYIKENPQVLELEDENKNLGTEELFKQWDKESRDDDVASDFSEEIVEAGQLPQANSAPPAKKLKRSHSASQTPPIPEEPPGVVTYRKPKAAQLIMNSPIPKPPQPTEIVNESRPKTSKSINGPVEAASADNIIEDVKPSRSNKKIGFIGFGNIGTILIKNLAHSRRELIVCSNSIEDSSNFSHCERVEKPAEVVDRCDIVFSCLPDCEDAREIMFTPGSGIFEKIGPSKSYIELSTLDLTTTLEINKAIQERGGHYLEAPMIGSIQDAKDGNLLFLCGGERSLFDSVVDCFQYMGHHAYYLGGVGCGTKIRLTFQMFSSCVVAAVAESMAMADRSGLNISDFGEILMHFAPGCQLITDAIQRITNERYLPPSYRLDSVQRELQYSVNLANGSFSQPTFLSSVASQLYLMAKKKGHGAHDYSSVFHVYQQENSKAKKRASEEK